MKSFKRSLFILFAPLFAATLSNCYITCFPGAEEKPCVPSALKCDDANKRILFCNPEKEWSFYKSCVDEGKLCEEGTCINPGEKCKESEQRCDQRNPGVLQRCDRSGNWLYYADCADKGKVCAEGKCAYPSDAEEAPCSPGERKCRDEYVTLLCDQNQTWQPYQDCSEYLKGCLNGSCGGCSPGASRCNPEKPTVSQRCVEAEAGAGVKWADQLDCSDLGYNVTCAMGLCLVISASDGDFDSPSDAEAELKSCSDDDWCNDGGLYCLKEPGKNWGTCRRWCSGASAEEDDCPRGYRCSLTGSRRCERVIDYCEGVSDCDGERQRCDLDPYLGWGLCKNICYLNGESCPAGSKCCQKDDSAGECYGKSGKCVSVYGSCSKCYGGDGCGLGYYCEKIAGQNVGCCKPKCYSNADCPAGLVCREDGTCGVGVGNCDCGVCAAGYVCDPLYCKCVLNCPACAPGYCCDEKSAPTCYSCQSCQNPIICGLTQGCCPGYHCSAIIYGVLGYCI